MRLRARDVGVRQDDRELVATEARDRVGASRLALQDGGGPRDRVVPDGVAVGVVDVLEVVEVDDQQRRGLVVARDVVPDPLELLLEPAPVEEPRQRVVVGQVLQLALVALLVGDVLEVADAVERRGHRASAPGSSGSAPRSGGRSRGGTASR